MIVSPKDCGRCHQKEVDEQKGSHHLLFALARIDVDPWEEANRLAAMPKAIAERILVSTIDQVLGKSWKPSETEVIVARLVQLLPHRGECGTIAPTETARVETQRAYWLLWLGFALAISLLSRVRCSFFALSANMALGDLRSVEIQARVRKCDAPQVRASALR